MAERETALAICSRTGAALGWTCLGRRKPDGVWTVRCPDCAEPPPRGWEPETPGYEDAE